MHLAIFNTHVAFVLLKSEENEPLNIQLDLRYHGYFQAAKKQTEDFGFLNNLHIFGVVEDLFVIC